MCSAGHAEDKTGFDKLRWEQTLSLDTTDTCIVHKQTNKDCTSRATTTLTDQLHQACSTNREENNKDVASACGKEQPRQRGPTDKLNYTSRFTRVIPTLSRDCHTTQHVTVVGVNMVVIGCSSQHLCCLQPHRVRRLCSRHALFSDRPDAPDSSRIDSIQNVKLVAPTHIHRLMCFLQTVALFFGSDSGRTRHNDLHEFD